MKKFNIDDYLNSDFVDSKNIDMKSFVQDKFFDEGHPFYKIKETIYAFLLWLVLIAPIIILINSLNHGYVWDDLYYWTYRDGFEIASFIQSAIFIGFVLTLILAIIMLIRNNLFYKNIVKKKITYDQATLNKRVSLIEDIYQQRFGLKKQRYATRYYSVSSDQNFENGYFHKQFKDKDLL
jgi:hypothetical protein